MDRSTTKAKHINPEFWDPPCDRETPDGTHRLWLDRPTKLLGPRTLGWVMCNPSTADRFTDDPTIRRVVDFTDRAGFNWALVGNLWTRRSTDPAALDISDPEANHHEADNVLRWLVAHSDAIVLAWGAGSKVRNREIYRKRSNEVTAILGAIGAKNLVTLGFTNDGYPRHPLFVPAAQAFQPLLVPCASRPSLGCRIEP